MKTLAGTPIAHAIIFVAVAAIAVWSVVLIHQSGFEVPSKAPSAWAQRRKAAEQQAADEIPTATDSEFIRENQMSEGERNDSVVREALRRMHELEKELTKFRAPDIAPFFA